MTVFGFRQNYVTSQKFGPLAGASALHANYGPALPGFSTTDIWTVHNPTNTEHEVLLRQIYPSSYDARLKAPPHAQVDNPTPIYWFKLAGYNNRVFGSEPVSLGIISPFSSIDLPVEIDFPPRSAIDSGLGHFGYVSYNVGLSFRVLDPDDIPDRGYSNFIQGKGVTIDPHLGSIPLWDNPYIAPYPSWDNSRLVVIPDGPTRLNLNIGDVYVGSFSVLNRGPDILTFSNHSGGSPPIYLQVSTDGSGVEKYLVRGSPTGRPTPDPAGLVLNPGESASFSYSFTVIGAGRMYASLTAGANQNSFGSAIGSATLTIDVPTAPSVFNVGWQSESGGSAPSAVPAVVGDTLAEPYVEFSFPHNLNSIRARFDIIGGNAYVYKNGVYQYTDNSISVSFPSVPMSHIEAGATYRVVMKEWSSSYNPQYLGTPIFPETSSIGSNIKTVPMGMTTESQGWSSHTAIDILRPYLWFWDEPFNQDFRDWYTNVSYPLNQPVELESRRIYEESINDYFDIKTMPITNIGTRPARIIKNPAIDWYVGTTTIPTYSPDIAEGTVLNPGETIILTWTWRASGNLNFVTGGTNNREFRIYYQDTIANYTPYSAYPTEFSGGYYYQHEIQNNGHSPIIDERDIRYRYILNQGPTVSFTVTQLTYKTFRLEATGFDPDAIPGQGDNGIMRWEWEFWPRPDDTTPAYLTVPTIISGTATDKIIVLELAHIPIGNYYDGKEYFAEVFLRGWDADGFSNSEFQYITSEGRAGWQIGAVAT